MPYLMKKANWFEEIIDRLRDYSEGNIWSSGDEILCKTEEVADALADMFECLYRRKTKKFLSILVIMTL